MNWYKKAQQSNIPIIPLSQVETGQPSIVKAYHGTPDARFLPEFDPNKKGYYPDAPELLPNNEEFISLYGDTGKGFQEESITGNIGVSFTDNPQTAKSYADKPAFDYQNSIPMVVERYVKLNNPKVIDRQGQEWEIRMNDDINTAIKEGYDSIVIKNVKDNYLPQTTSRPTNNLVLFNVNNIVETNKLKENIEDNIKINIKENINNINKNKEIGKENELI